MYETDVYKVAAYLMVAGSERWKGQIQIWTGQLFVSSVKKVKNARSIVVCTCMYALDLHNLWKCQHLHLYD